MAEENNWLEPLFTPTFKSFVPMVRSSDLQFDTKRRSPQDFAKGIAEHLGLSGVTEPPIGWEVLTWGHKDREFKKESTFAWAVAKAMPEEYRLMNLIPSIDWDMVYKLWQASEGNPHNEKVASKIDKTIREENAAYFGQQYSDSLGLTAETSNAATDQFLNTDIKSRSGLTIPQNDLLKVTGTAEKATDVIENLPTAAQIESGASLGTPAAAGQQQYDPWSVTASDMTEQDYLQQTAGSTIEDLIKVFGEDTDFEFNFANLPSAYRPSGATLKFDPRQALSYIYKLNSDQVFDLQENLAKAGYFDQVGSQYGQAGVVDQTTRVAWDMFLADSARTGVSPGKLMESKLISYLRTRNATSGFVGSDPAAISQSIRQLGVEVIGRGLNKQEELALTKAIRGWEREAALGPTFAQDNYQIDINAKATEYMEKQFATEAWQNDLDKFFFEEGA